MDYYTKVRYLYICQETICGDLSFSLSYKMFSDGSHHKIRGLFFERELSDDMLCISVEHFT